MLFLVEIPEFVEDNDLKTLLQSYGEGDTFHLEYIAPHLPEK